MNAFRVALIAVCAALLLAAASAGAASHAKTQTCKVFSIPDGYVTSLNVTGVTCATGKKVALAYRSCRLHNGGVTGHCKSKVLGFTCKEGPRMSIPTEFDARVTCTKGSERIVHTYQQNT
jgi:hypothetical protein